MNAPEPDKRIFDDEYFADPYARYAELHASGCPVHRTVTPEGVEAWLVTDHDAVRSGLKDARLSRRLENAGPGYRRAPFPVEMLSKSVVTEDPPVHTRLRRRLNAAFSPRSIGQLRPQVEAVTGRLVAAVAARLEAGEPVDLFAELALPLPLTVIAELLGIPLDRRDDFHRWGDGMLSLDPAEQRDSSVAMWQFLTEMLKRVSEEPDGNMLSQWVHEVDEQGQRLEPQEVLGLAMVMLVGGYDTSVGAIAATLTGLLGNPDQLERLRAEPELLPNVVEEYLRFYGSVHTGIRRFATEDFDLGGQVIAQGDTVLLSIAAADRDPKRFPAPGEVDFDRPDPRGHLAFGNGPHVCPGNELGRMEISIVVDAVVNRLPDLRLTVPVAEIPWRRANFIRIPLAVPVERVPRADHD